MNQADAEIPAAVAGAIPQIATAVGAIAETLQTGGRLFYVGAGTSGRLGFLDAAECPPTFGVRPEMVRAILAGGDQAFVRAVEGAEDDFDAGGLAIGEAGVTRQDAVVGISASGRTPFVLGAAQRARQQGAVTCGISCASPSELSAGVQFPVEIPTGPEILTGSTRLRAGTATKLVLNMISTAVMVRLGYVYGNLMVNVQPTNAKLRDRARRIVEQAAEVDTDRAAELLESSGWSVRTAIVMAKRGLGRAEAERLLDRAGGRVREALTRLPEDP
jgi:N-acetylmuramic acid 6-phosphate etherase